MEGFSMEKAGIERERCCTDIFCLVIFWAFIGAMCYGTWFGFHNGQVSKLTAPIDGALNFCGFDNTATGGVDMKGYPKMMLTSFDATKTLGILKSGVCLKTCPKEKGKTLVDGTDCKSNKNYECGKHESYVTRDAFDFCLPASADALKPAEKDGYDYLIK